MRKEIDAQALAIADMEEKQTAGARSRVHANVRDVEAILYRRAKIAPRPPRRKTPVEDDVAKVSFEGKVASRVLMDTADMVQTCTLATLAALRGVKTIVDKLDIHSRAILDVQDDVAQMRRVLRRYDTPLDTQDLTTNPSLNPALNNYVPFDEPTLVKEFFQSKERIKELTRFVINNVKFKPSNFVRRMIAMCCTLDYREKFAFPGDNVQSKLVYIPDKLAEFFITTTRIAAHRKKQGISQAKVRDQCRVAFQRNVVRKERKQKKDMLLPPEKRSKYMEGFTTSESEGEELREEYDIDSTLVQFSYLEKTNNGDSGANQSEADPNPLDEAFLEK